MRFSLLWVMKNKIQDKESTSHVFGVPETFLLAKLVTSVACYSRFFVLRAIWFTFLNAQVINVFCHSLL